jgi:hypothetical protein
MASIRLRCLRCGDWAEMDPTATHSFGLCDPCGEWIRRRVRAWGRWVEAPAFHVRNHPTYKALSAALDALESTPHGTLVEMS